MNSLLSVRSPEQSKVNIFSVFSSDFELIFVGPAKFSSSFIRVDHVRRMKNDVEMVSLHVVIQSTMRIRSDNSALSHFLLTLELRTLF